MAVGGYLNVKILSWVFVFSSVLIWSAIEPADRLTWWMEVIPALLGFVILLMTRQRFLLTEMVYFLILIHAVILMVGGHFTYAEVPYDGWLESLFGRGLNETLGWDRNHFDRLVHFSWGLLITYPVREMFLRVANASGFWGYLFPMLVVMSSSLLFELIEWAAAIVFGGELGMAYLGTQGDIWDSHKDSALATLGSLIASAVIAGIHSGLDRDFTREWVDSLRVKHPDPMGEVAVERMRNARQHEAD